MSPVVERLRDDHRFLLQLLVGATLAPSEERRIRLAHARSALVAHIAREELHIYPGMQHTPESAALAQRFEEDMNRMGPRLLQILEQIVETPDGDEVPFVIRQIFEALRERINAEELVLYAAFDAQPDAANEPEPEEMEESNAA